MKKVKVKRNHHVKVFRDEIKACENIIINFFLKRRMQFSIKKIVLKVEAIPRRGIKSYCIYFNTPSGKLDFSQPTECVRTGNRRQVCVCVGTREHNVFPLNLYFYHCQFYPIRPRKKLVKINFRVNCLCSNSKA